MLIINYRDMYGIYTVVAVVQIRDKHMTEHLLCQLKTYRPFLDNVYMFTDTSEILVQSPYKDFTTEFMGRIWPDWDAPPDTAENTIFVKFDDDIVKMDDNDHFKHFLEYRVRCDKNTLVSANVVGTHPCAKIHQRLGITYRHEITPIPEDSIQIPLDTHKKVLRDGLNSFRFDMTYRIFKGEDVPLNVVSWFNHSDIDVRNGCIVYGNYACCKYDRREIKNTTTLKQYTETPKRNWIHENGTWKKI